MDLFYLASFGILFYCLAAYLQLLSAKRRASYKGWVLFFGFLGVLSHGWLLHLWIDTGVGQNLTVYNMLSFGLWVVALIMVLISLVQPTELSTIFVFPLAALSIVVAENFSGHMIVDMAKNPAQLVHIFLSVSAFGVLCAAAFQGLMIAMVERRLKGGKPSTFLKYFPPLQTQERLLFQIIWLGFILLTLVLITSLYVFHGVISYPIVMQKTALVIITWIIFAILLVGRHCFGWRGRIVVYGTLLGVIFLVVAYLGSKLVLEALS